jgi:hypothetical protein
LVLFKSSDFFFRVLLMKASLLWVAPPILICKKMMKLISTLGKLKTILHKQWDHCVEKGCSRLFNAKAPFRHEIRKRLASSKWAG